MKKVLVLGSTGSIGRSTLDIIRSYPGEFHLAGLHAHSNEERLLADAKNYSGIPLCLSSGTENPDIKYRGPEGILEL
ncbi:MAG: 1-deoxy-D-xylulose-5-phosphate reductoisomerase, partial [Spirochaetales bacterium]|nr:1-deoxy-D-xylulose-5-phosphate reductoisomerase [Spirochaetales bacterium]